MQISQTVSSRFWGQRKGEIEVSSMFLQSTFFLTICTQYSYLKVNSTTGNFQKFC